jgi:Na+-transporting NADH:ubiquinone oxidoreductase subunit NqrC
MPDFVRWIAPAALVIMCPQAQAVQYLTLAQAQAMIFPGAQEFAPMPLRLSRDQARAIEQLSGVTVRAPEQQVWRVQGGGTQTGWFIVDEVIGKHELITYAIGLEQDGRVRQIEVMDYRESYGYEVRNPKWRRQFVGKRHGDALTLEGDIKNITGATLSCRHLTEGVRRVLATHQVALLDGR